MRGHSLGISKLIPNQSSEPVSALAKHGRRLCDPGNGCSASVFRASEQRRVNAVRTVIGITRLLLASSHSFREHTLSHLRSE